MNRENKHFVVDTKFIKTSLESDLNMNEFLLMIFFNNMIDPTLDLDLIKKCVKLSDEDILIAFDSLVNKKLINIDVSKDDNNNMTEKISLNGFYNKIVKKETFMKKEKSVEDIYSIIETEFGRTLSQIDYNLIKSWIDKGYAEELIISALKETLGNGVTSLRYIDKILFDWNKKGIKRPNDIISSKEDNLDDTKLLNFNWLDND